MAGTTDFRCYKPRGCAWKWNAYEWIFILSSHNPFCHFLALIGRHRYTMAGIAYGEIDSVQLPSVRHDVEGKIERASPDILNACVT